jgi:hypothetical protein
MRYTDEGETTEICKWTVDLAPLPSFQQAAAGSQFGGFYTGALVLYYSNEVKIGLMRRFLFLKNLSLDWSWIV